MTKQTGGSGVASAQKLQLNGNSTAQGNGSVNPDISGSPAPPILAKAKPTTTVNTTNNSTEKWWFRLWQYVEFQTKAYGGSLILTSISFPIFASAVTVSLYITQEKITLPVLYLEHINSTWYAPVYGFLISFLALLLFAILRTHSAKAKGANMNVYKTLKSRHSDLQACLGNISVSHTKNSNGSYTYQEQYEDEMKAKMEPHFNLEKDSSNRKYQEEALRKIYEAYCDLDRCLFHTHSGTEWVFGIGYTNAWRIVHRAHEVLIDVETPSQVINNVLHDMRSIQNSLLTDRTTLIRKMLQGVKDLDPEALPYFEELRSDKNYTDLFDPPITNQHNASPWNFLQNFFKKPPTPLTRSPEMAREAIRQVKHTLNLYQDSLRETLVRLRNHILICIALTGFVTYFLVCSLILWKTSATSISAATIYYIIATIAGLFVRFYNESNNKNALEDYGLFSARLMATPLLSGLAGVGGVLVSATVYSLGATGATKSSLSAFGTIFSYPINLDYLIAAAIFGSTPNLIISTLQQRAQKYSTDLQNSKGEGSNKYD